MLLQHLISYSHGGGYFSIREAARLDDVFLTGGMVMFSRAGSLLAIAEAVVRFSRAAKSNERLRQRPESEGRFQ